MSVTATTDPVNSPSHYKLPCGLEAIDIIESADLGYHLGNTVKYILRHKKKGKPLEDLKKAKWYLDRYIKTLTA